jgi:MoxR-like ATPase
MIPENKSCMSILEEVSKVIVGKRNVLENLMLAILSDGHVLIEDYPGLAKTLMAKSFASAMSLRFKRIQFTPDLLPADVTGTYVLNRKTSDFELRKGPIFTNILLADEVNRAPPRTQSALLEAMQEKQVTIENETLKLEKPFIVLATQNPIEYEGTYPLPEAQLDRFLVKLSIGYPSAEEEVQILERRNQRKTDEVSIEKVASLDQLLQMQKAIEDVHIDQAIERYIVEVVRATRSHQDVEVGASPRGSLAIMRLSKTKAWLNGRDYVIPDDVKTVTVPALSHRLILKPEQWLKGGKTAAIVEELLRIIAVPKVD